MAKFFEKIKKVNKKAAKEEPSFENINVYEPQEEFEDMTPAQRTRRNNMLNTINEGHVVPKEYEGITQEKVREDLERRVTQKLDKIYSADDIFAQIQAEKEQQRRELAQQSEMRKKRREQKKFEQEEMEPVVTEDAVIAIFHEEELEPEREMVHPVIEPIQEEKENNNYKHGLAIPMDGQMTISDINSELQREKEADEKIKEAEEAEAAEEEFESLEEADVSEETVFDLKTKAFFVTLYRKTKLTFKKIARNRKNKKKAKAKRNSGEGKHAKKKNIVFEKLSCVGRKIIEIEKKASNKLGSIVSRMDARGDAIAERAEEAASIGKIRFHRSRQWLDENKAKVLSAFGGIVFSTFILIMALNYFTAYEYAYNGKTLGKVKDQDDVLKILDIVSEQLTREHNAEVVIEKDEDITFKKIWNMGYSGIDNMEDVLRRLTYMQDMSIKGYGIYVENKLIDIVESEALANEILETVLAVYTPNNEGVQYEDVGFAENIEIVPVDTKLGRLASKDDLVYKILTGAEEQKVHIVQSGETFSEIAKVYGLTQADLQASNPQVIPERLSIGQEIVLTQAVPLLTVQTVEIANYIEYIPYETVYEDNASIYIGETSTKKRGENGEKYVTAKIVRNNGIEVAKLELNSLIKKEPVTAIVYKGTKELPPKKGTGTFKYPVSGYTLTSKYGQRWGRMHNGIDMAAPTGTKIRATDGGTVIFSGYQGSYGYVVKIDHGGGFVSVYAHCSKLHVRVGESVYQGQHIANVGNTGRSTGPHLHFEIQYLGKAKNPFNYL